jgi:hypothetical protein
MTYTEILREVYAAIRYTNDAAERGDVKRNHVNYGTLLAYGRILNAMGHKADLNNAWENESGCLVIARARVDGEELAI